MVLQEEWQRLVSGYSTDVHLMDAFWQEIYIAYTARGRHYHNLQHLTELLALAGTYRTQLQHPDLVKFAIFYHDIVYNPLKSDNEAQSAALAEQRLQQLGMDHQKCRQVSAMILATKGHAPSGANDTDLLLDFDLSILGAEWEKYYQYTQQIRREYRLIPFFLYRKGRRKVVNQFLCQSSIYKSVQFHQQLERAARINLQKELALLS